MQGKPFKKKIELHYFASQWPIQYVLYIRELYYAIK